VSRRPVVLCIDDHIPGLVTRKALLESSGFHVLTAEDGRSGLEIVSRKLVDAVVVDYKMPGMDGEKVALELRAKYPHVPILLLTGCTGHIPALLLKSVDGLLEKGSSATELIEKLRRLTGTSSTRTRVPAMAVQRKAGLLDANENARTGGRTALVVRCSQEQAAEIREAAKHERRTLSGYILNAVLSRYGRETRSWR
jgi:CheY-like chemotaxis protein